MSYDEAEVKLTPTEFRLLASIAAEPGTVVRRRVAVAAAWLDGAMVSEIAIDSFVLRRTHSCGSCSVAGPHSSSHSTSARESRREVLERIVDPVDQMSATMAALLSTDRAEDLHVSSRTTMGEIISATTETDEGAPSA